jgi:hypothetical protein
MGFDGLTDRLVCMKVKQMKKYYLQQHYILHYSTASLIVVRELMSQSV